MNASICKKCLWVEWNTGDRCCRLHGFKPNHPLPPEKTCRDPDSRKNGGEE